MPAIKALLTTGVAYLRSIAAGSGGAAGGPGITIFSSTAAVATDDGTLKTLISYTLPANTLTRDGDRLEIEGATTQAADADVKTSAITFGASTAAGRTAADNNLGRLLKATIIRTGAATQLFQGNTETHGNGDVFTVGTASETLSGAITIALKGQNTTDATPSSVTSRYLIVKFYPAP